MRPAPRSQPHTRRCTPNTFTSLYTNNTDSELSPHTPFPDPAEYLSEFSKLTQDNHLIEEKAKGLTNRMKEFKGKLNEIRMLEKDLAMKEEEGRLQNEENERIRKDLARALAHIRELEDPSNRPPNSISGLEPAQIKTKLLQAHHRLSKLALLSQQFLQHTMKLFSDPKDPTLSRISEMLSGEINKSVKEASNNTRQAGSRHGSPKKEKVLDTKPSDRDISKLTRQNESLRKSLELSQAQLKHLQSLSSLPRDTRRLESLLSDLSQKNLSQESVIQHLEAQLKSELTTKGQLRLEQEALERDCEELKRENAQFVEELEWMGKEHKAFEAFMTDQCNGLSTLLHDQKSEFQTAYGKLCTHVMDFMGKIEVKMQRFQAKIDQAKTLIKHDRRSHGTQVQTLQEQLQHLEQLYDSETDRSKTLLSDLRTSENALDSLKSKLVSIEKRATTDVLTWKARLSTAELEAKTTLQTKIAELGRFQTRVRDLETLLTEAETGKSELLETSSRSESDKKRLESDLKTQKQTIDQLTHKLSILEKTRVKDAEDALKREIDSRKRLELDLEKKKTAKFNLRQKLMGMKSLIFRLNGSRKTVISMVEELGKIVSDAQTESSTIRLTSIQRQTSTIQKLELQIKLLQEENSALGSENSVLYQEAEQLKANLEQEKAAKSHKEMAILEVNSTMQALHASWQASNQQSTDLYELAIALQIQLKEAELQRDEFREQGMMLIEDWVRVEERTVPIFLYLSQVKKLEKENDRKEKELDQVTESLFKLISQQEEQQDSLAQKERALNRAEEDRFRLEQLLASSRKMVNFTIRHSKLSKNLTKKCRN